MKYTIQAIRFLMLAAIVFFNSCTDISEDNPVVNPDLTTTVSLSTSEDIILTEDLEGQEVLTISWTAPDFGFDGAVPAYNLKISVPAASEGVPTNINVGNNLSYTLKVEELNKAVNDAGALAGLGNEVSLQVQFMLGKEVVGTSTDQMININSYSTILDLSSPWGIVGSATPNGWDGPDLPAYRTSVGNEFVAYVTLAEGEIKIRRDNDWTVNYGDTGLDGTLNEGGDNIAVEAGTYRINFSLNDFSYSITPYTLGIVGSAAENGWDGPDMPLTFDPTSDQWRAVVTLGAGEIKFRENNDWTVNYGDDNADGTLEAGGANIAVTAGNYLVSVNLNELEYSLEPIDIWGLVGSATPNGWDGPDVRFTPDYANEGVWVLENVSLVAGEIKFRTNDDWGLNYGDDGVDGTLEADGANIAVEAGTYTIRLDFSDETNPTYTITN